MKKTLWQLHAVYHTGKVRLPEPPPEPEPGPDPDPKPHAR